MNVRNSVTLIGNVGQIPTSKTLPSGTRVIEFSLATNDTYRNRDGEKVTRTEWHRIHAYGKVVEVLERYLNKGTKLALTGTLRYSKWTDKYDQSRTTTEIILDEFTFLGGKGSDSSTSTNTERETEMMVAEPAPEVKTGKRRAKSGKGGGKATKATEMTAAEDLPF